MRLDSLLNPTASAADFEKKDVIVDILVFCFIMISPRVFATPASSLATVLALVISDAGRLFATPASSLATVLALVISDAVLCTAATASPDD